MVAANSNKKCLEYAEQHPDGFGMIYSPSYWNNPPVKPNIKYVLDNGCFGQFDENLFFKVLSETLKMDNKPMWIVAPDVIGCHTRTLALWFHYYKTLRLYGYPLAFVAQDGCMLSTVPTHADLIFIGGHPDTDWKLNNYHKFIGSRPVHVGRINEGYLLDMLEEKGVASCDGSGWFRGGVNSRQACDLDRWFNGDPQRKLWEV